MGGFGSGRWLETIRRNGAVEYCRVLSIRLLRKHGLIDADKVAAVQWRNEAGKVMLKADVETIINADADKTLIMVVRREVLSTDGKQKTVEQRIRLTASACNYGGVRYWFECPVVKDGMYCGNRCAKLYLPDGQLYFGCRECYDLTYQSCQKSHKYDNLDKHLADIDMDSLTMTQVMRLAGL